MRGYRSIERRASAGYNNNNNNVDDDIAYTVIVFQNVIILPFPSSN